MKVKWIVILIIALVFIAAVAAAVKYFSGRNSSPSGAKEESVRDVGRVGIEINPSGNIEDRGNQREDSGS